MTDWKTVKTAGDHYHEIRAHVTQVRAQLAALEATEQDALSAFTAALNGWNAPVTTPALQPRPPKRVHAKVPCEHGCGKHIGAGTQARHDRGCAALKQAERRPEPTPRAETNGHPKARLQS